MITGRLAVLRVEKSARVQERWDLVGLGDASGLCVPYVVKVSWKRFDSDNSGDE
jgi:hypothetical protein